MSILPDPGQPRPASGDDAAVASDRTLSTLGPALGPDEPFRPELPGYEVLRELHRGGQGIVLLAVQRSTGRQVAVKVLRSGAGADPGERMRFEREVHVLASLNHPNIVTIHDSGHSSAGQFFVMQYIAGDPLDEYVRRKALSVRATLQLLLKVCDALHAAHRRGIVHRDLKPSNIRVDAAGEPHVLDFGLAKLAGRDPAADMTRTRAAGPEAASGAADGAHPIDFRSYSQETQECPTELGFRQTAVVLWQDNTKGTAMKGFHGLLALCFLTTLVGIPHKPAEARDPQPCYLGGDWCYWGGDWPLAETDLVWVGTDSVWGGDWPLAETDLVWVGTDSTYLIVQIDGAVHRVYLLKSRFGPHRATVKLVATPAIQRSWTADVDRYVETISGGSDLSAPLKVSDASNAIKDFVAHVKQRALQAGVRTPIP